MICAASTSIHSLAPVSAGDTLASQVLTFGLVREGGSRK